MQKKSVVVSSGIIFIAIGLGLLWWFYFPLHYNLRTVIPKQVYRSAQLPANILLKLITEKHIRSIINLRNSHPKAQWWREELKISQEHDITLYNLSLPAHYLPTKKQLEILTATVANAKRPILIHCRQGYDRSGLASAIALILNNDSSYANIYKQVGWQHLVLDWRSVGKIALPYYQHWLVCHNTRPSKNTWYAWLNQAKPLTLDSCRH